MVRGRPPAWTPDEAAIARLGVDTDVQIAADEGVSVGTVARYRRRIGILYARGRGRSVSYREARRLRSEGYSLRDVAALLGTSHGTVLRALRGEE